MTKIELTQTATRLVVGTSVGTVVSVIIKNLAPPKNLLAKAEVVVAGFVVGSIVGEIAENWAVDKLDEAVAWWQINVK